MANALYDLGRNRFLSGSIAYLTDTIKAALVSASYTPNLTTDEFLSDVGANIVGTAQTLGTKTATAGVADAADVTYTAVTGSQVVYIVLYKDVGGIAANSPLIALIDTASNLPVTPNGGDINIAWSNSSSKIFKL